MEKKRILYTAYSIEDINLFISLNGKSANDYMILTARLSSYLYAKYMQLSVTSMFHIPIKASFYSLSRNKRNLEIDNRFYEQFKISDNYLRISKELYLKYLKKNLDSDFDLVFHTGTARVFEQAVDSFYKNTKKIYWEAGPKGNIYFSKTGVNADADFRDISANGKNIISNLFKDQCKISVKQIKKANPFITFIFKLLELTYILFLNIALNKEMNEFIPKLRSKPITNKQNIKNKYILFIDQVEADVNSTHHGASIEEIKNLMIKVIDFYVHSYKDIKILRRKHPRQNQTKVARLLSKSFPNKFIEDTNQNISESINNAELVITVNSTAGLETLIHGKPILVIGNSYYDKQKGVIKKNQLDNFGKLSEELSKVGSESIEKNAKDFIESNFIPIDYRGKILFEVFGFDEFISLCLSEESLWAK